MIHKTRKLWLIMLALMMTPTIGAYAQVNEITLSKPGRLSKELGKNADTITILKVNGDINGEDIEYMISMSKLNSLDLGNARISENYSYSIKSRSENFNSQTLLISGSRFYRKLVMPMSCTNLVILPPVPTDSVYALDYCIIGKMEAASGINSITCSKQLLIMMLDMKNHTFDIAKHESVLPCLIKQEDKVYIRFWTWSIDELIAYGKKQNISSFEGVFPYGLSSIPCGETLDLSLVNLRTIGLYAFADSPVKHIIMPKSIQEISDLAFENTNVESVEFVGENAPVFIGDKNKNNAFVREKYPIDVSSWAFSVIVPDEYFQRYQLGEWKNLVVKKKNANTKYEFIIEKPGTLSKYLTNEIVNSAESLTLKGILYDTEIERLNDCKGLKYLDISCCYVAKSPQTIEKEQANREFQLAVLQMVGEMVQKDARSKFEQGTISYAEAMNNVMWGKYAETVAEQASQNKVVADINCICPELNLGLLKEYHMPAQIKVIRDVGYLPMVEKIVLPPSATDIYYYAFSDLKKLRDINFPKTLMYIGNAAFKNCKSLNKLDFSNTALKEIVIRRGDYGRDSGLFYGCDNLKEVRFPASLTTLADEGEVPEDCVLYFYSPEIPISHCWWEPKTIHVPRGTKAGWGRWISDGVNVIDDL